MHRCGVLHNDIEPQNVIRRSSPHPGIVDDNDGDLCLIDFSEAQLGTEQELAEETEVLEEALNLSVERLPGDPDE